MKKGSHSWNVRELGNEKMLLISQVTFNYKRHSPAKVSSIKINEETKRAVS
jgi:hypothetical protein